MIVIFGVVAVIGLAFSYAANKQALDISKQAETICKAQGNKPMYDISFRYMGCVER